MLPAGTRLQVTGEFQEAGQCDWWPVTVSTQASPASSSSSISNLFPHTLGEDDTSLSADDLAGILSGWRGLTAAPQRVTRLDWGGCADQVGPALGMIGADVQH